MTVYVWTDSDGRVGAVTDDVRFSDGATAVEYPDVPEDETIFDYVLRDGALVYDPLPEPEPAPDPVAIATEARQLAEEAKSIAEQAGTDPQLAALATMQVATMSFDKVPCDEVAKFVNYWPEWKPDTAYKHNDPITYQGRKFRASKDLTSQAIYPPGTAESEYYEVKLAADGIIIWYNVGGEYNMVYKGERRHYPDASGPVYEALENTSYSPDAYPQHWKLVEE